MGEGCLDLIKLYAERAKGASQEGGKQRARVFERYKESILCRAKRMCADLRHDCLAAAASAFAFARALALARPGFRLAHAALVAALLIVVRVVILEHVVGASSSFHVLLVQETWKSLLRQESAQSEALTCLCTWARCTDVLVGRRMLAGVRPAAML